MAGLRPVDPRLLRFSRSSRGFIVLAIVIGCLTAALVILQARLLSNVIVGVTQDGLGWSTVADTVLALAAVFSGRVIVGWGGELAAYRAAAGAKEELRRIAAEEMLAGGPYAYAGRHPAEIALLLTRGIDALDGYFARYLPQLVLSVIVPIAVLLTVLQQDLLSAVIIAVTLPLIPIFMILIGLYTKSRVDRQWRTLAVLSGHFLDLIAGLPTLQVFGRAKAQAAAILAIGDRYRSTTMGILRVTFLSSLALELLAMLSVALVAVSLGLRLAEQQVTYSIALFVLLLAPEAYLPLRLVGQHYHAAAEGLGAAQQIFALLETPGPGRSAPGEVDDAGFVAMNAATVTLPDRATAALQPTSFVAMPGTVTVLIGPSGGGKSTAFAVLAGFIEPSAGTVTVPQEIAYLPQHPALVDSHLSSAPTVGSALRLGAPEASDGVLLQALERVGVRAELGTDPLSVAVPEDGSGVSAGQRQRIAIARTLLRAAPVVLLDEPTASLDGTSELVVIDAIRAEAERGAIVIAATHRPAILAIADQIVVIAGSEERLNSQAAPQPMPEAARQIIGVGW